MGLDVTAYRKLTQANGNEAFDEEGEIKYDDGFIQMYKNPDFPGRADEIEDRKAYRYEDAEGFPAGSHGGYNNWRNELAKLAGYPMAKPATDARHPENYVEACWEGSEGPFYELISFSDCEGVIGASISAKLAKDFADFQGKADANPSETFRRKYGQWRKAFEMASDGGAVDFH